MITAITRRVSARFNECEITHIDRNPINLQTARNQHHGYLQALSQAGCTVVELPAEDDLPDSVFVEDTAIVLPEVAVITRPGADSRKAETLSVSSILSQYRPLTYITEPATLDGGDVLPLGKNIYIGLSTRSTTAALQQMQNILKFYGYNLHGVPLHNCLHLKTAVTQIDETTLLVNKNWIDLSLFSEHDWIEVDETEPAAANCLSIDQTILFPAAFPKTQDRLTQKGYSILALPMEEFAKAEGGVTCCSLIIR